MQKITFVLRKISKNCCHHSFVGWSFAPRPHWGGYSATPDSLAVFRQFRGLTSKQRGGERRGREEEGRERRGREGRGEKEFVLCPSKKKEKSAPTVQLLTSADNVALTPFAHRTLLLRRGCCWPPARRPYSNRSIYPVRRAHSSKPAVAACGGRMEQTGRQTDTRQLRIPPALHTMWLVPVSNGLIDWLIDCRATGERRYW